MRLLLTMLVLVLGGCGERRTKIEKPTPPDMSAVVKRYEAPDGVFDQAHAKAILDDYATRTLSVADVGLADEIMSSLRAAMDEAIANSSESTAYTPGVSRQSLELEANGTMSVERICSGWGPEPAPDRANGTLDARVNFSESGLDPVVWGNAHACHYRVGDVANVNIDDGGTSSDVKLWLGTAATFESFGSEPIIFDVDLATEVEGAAVPLTLSFELDPNSKLVGFALEASPGTVVVSPSVSTALHVQALNGTFECDVPAGQCTSDTGQTFAF